VTNVLPKTRPDLTSYRIYIDVLLERLNQDAVYKVHCGLDKIADRKGNERVLPRCRDQTKAEAI